MISGGQLADKGLIKRLAEVGWVVVCVCDDHRHADVAAEGGVAVVRHSDDEVVALDELVVESVRHEYQTAAAVHVEVVGAVVKVRKDLVAHDGVLLRILILSKHLQGEH